MKYKSKIKDGRLTIKAKIPGGIQVAPQELDFFGKKIIRGFFKVEMVKSNTLEYTGPMGVPLADRLKQPISRYDFLFIMEQIVDNTQKLQNNGMLWNKVVWDINNVYINVATKELQFMYLPFTTPNPDSWNIYTFLESIVFAAKPVADQYNPDYIPKFSYFLRSLNGYNPQSIEAYIANEDRSIVNTIKKSRGGNSGYITDKRRDYYEHYDSSAGGSASAGSAPIFGGSASAGNAPYFGNNDNEGTALLVESGDTSLSSSNGIGYDPYFERQNAPADNGDDFDDATGLLVESDNGYSNNQNAAESDDFDDATGLLVESDSGSDFSTDVTDEDPAGGQQGFNPVGGQQSFNPAGGQQGFNPAGGQQGFNPTGGQQNSNPVGGQSGFNPAGGQQKFNPIGGQQGFNPAGGQQKFNPAGGQQGFNPAGGQQSFNPIGGQQSFNPEDIHSQGSNDYNDYDYFDDYEENGTELLVEDNNNEREEADRNNQPDGAHYPSLYRILTKETIIINKPVFRIGKEKSYVDYFVSNNNAVSRNHADIVTRGRKCFVVDLNSKNKTYINCQVLPVRCEIEIHDGDRLKLGNEEFIFIK